MAKKKLAAVESDAVAELDSSPIPAGDSAEFDSLVVITMFTPNAERRDQLDKLIDDAFARDGRVQIVRVVGYSTAEEAAAIARAIK